VSEVSSTDAARNFADLLDAVEHRGERFTIVRRGRAIAHLEPVRGGTGGAVKDVLRRHGADASWTEELVALRQLVEVEERS
jgi:prevent-host-death family protein